MVKVGITGQSGFIAYQLRLVFSQNRSFQIVNFQRHFFADTNLLDKFTGHCDVIVHLSAVILHNEENYIYQTNINLVDSLIESIKRTKSKPLVIFISSSHEKLNTVYGKSKKEGRIKLADFSQVN